jgi:hypothetical protein
MPDEPFKAPRAPRRHQAEVDAARHEANVLRDELRAVRDERRELKAEAARLRVALREYGSHQAMPETFTVYVCPDCGAPACGARILHRDTCTIEVSGEHYVMRAVRVVPEADLSWVLEQRESARRERDEAENALQAAEVDNDHLRAQVARLKDQRERALREMTKQRPPSSGGPLRREDE